MTKKHLVRLYPNFKIVCNTKTHNFTIDPNYVTCLNCLRCMSLAEHLRFIGENTDEIYTDYQYLKRLQEDSNG